MGEVVPRRGGGGCHGGELEEDRRRRGGGGDSAGAAPAPRARRGQTEAGAHDGSVVYLFFITSIGDPNWLPFLDDHDVG